MIFQYPPMHYKTRNPALGSFFKHRFNAKIKIFKTLFIKNSKPLIFSLFFKCFFIDFVIKFQISRVN